MSNGYEFRKEDEDLIGSLSSKMSFVGVISLILGVLYFISAFSFLMFTFRDTIPPDVMARIPEEVRSKLTDNRFLFGAFLQVAAVGLMFILIGTWTRSAGSSFHQIVSTSGRDISHLMKGLVSLHRMYTLIYTLIIVTLLISLIGVLMQLWTRFGG